MNETGPSHPLDRDRRRRLVLVLLGAWLTLIAATWFGATVSFKVAADLAEGKHDGAGASQWTETMGPVEDARSVARYQAAEFNRRMFRAASRTQVVLAGLVVLLAAMPPRLERRSVLALLAAAGAAVLAAALMPTMADLGEQLAFMPKPLPDDLAPVRDRMMGLHAAQAGLDLARVALLLLTAVWLLGHREPADGASTVT